jgi:hypothetical protein
VRLEGVVGKTFKQGTAVISAQLSGCGPGVCGSETDEEVVEIRR